ncbi:MAG: amylo-alpha-1,6-glucosidase [Candidatus Cybelea sp.]
MTARVRGSGERISTYVVPDTQMAVGSTLGSPKAVVVLKANGAIERFYSIDAGKVMIGGVQIAFWDGASGARLGKLPGDFVIHPDRQEHVYELSNGLTVRESAFVLSGEPETDSADPAMAYLTVALECTGDEEIGIAVIASAQMRGGFGPTNVRYDAQRKAFIAVSEEAPEYARAFVCSRAPAHWEVTDDHGKPSRMRSPGPLADRTLLDGGHEAIALFEHHLRLKPAEKLEFWYQMVGAARGVRELRRIVDGSPGARSAARQTRARFDRLLSRAVLMTPDPEVNRGALWAKANMLRVELLAPTGWCFVNDPAKTNNSVARDTAWFAFGADFVTPDFVRESLLKYVELMERRGMVVEYYDIRTGKTADYKLNINDNTPLIVLALWHHYNATGDAAFLRRVYRASKRAADYILSQRNAQGLVWCTATGTADWGIVGWRNVIAGYRISGATTELNSECYAALRAVSKMARVLRKEGDRAFYRRAAEDLRDAVNEHLIDPETGYYYLCIDVDGAKRTNITCDLVFPVMFGVADRECAARIVSRLSAESFWTAAGIRTIPGDDIDYGPTHGYGLLGGVWVGVTFWYAFAASRFNPDFMASALRESFVHYSRDPLGNNTVPGQFSEWLHGETLANRGMMLSPWFPPRFLWAAIEGAAGLDLSGDEPICTPCLAPNWSWLGVRRLCFRGEFISWFVVRTDTLRLYGSFRFGNPLQCQVYDRDVTDEYLISPDGDIAAIALEREQQVVIFAGNTAERTVTTTVRFLKGLGIKYAARSYNSLRGEWIGGDITERQLRKGLALEIDGGGFCVIELTASQ